MRNVFVQKGRGRNLPDQTCQGTKRPGPKRPGAKRPGPKGTWAKRPKSPGVKLPGPKCQGAKHPGPKCKGAKRLVQNVSVLNVQVKRPGPKCQGRNVLSKTSWGGTSLSEMSECENTFWAFTSWLWNFLYDCDTRWGFFMIVRFFYYYYLTRSLVWLNSGKYDTVDQKLSFGNDV